MSRCLKCIINWRVTNREDLLGGGEEITTLLKC